jgi:DNA repair exonuclease SbcCD ATPase subunit
MKKVNIGIENVTEIFQIADVHIRTLKRHDEYKKVFENLYEEVEKRKTQGSVIAVLGDVVHAKTDLTPELVDVASNFLRRLSSVAPVILIPGNHDENLVNHDRMDSLTPIVKNIDTSRIYYSRETETFDVGGVAFAHMSQLDKPKNYPKANSIPDSKPKVALYHGVVNGATTDTGWTLSSEKVNVGMFEGYDMALLGDIHKRQFLDSNERVLYSGSLVQQNHGEPVSGHGVNLWSIEDKDVEFIPVKNEYGFYTLDVENGAYPVPEDVPKKPRLRLHVQNTDPVETKRIVADLRKMYDVQEVSVNRSGVSSSLESENGESSLEIGNVQDVERQNELIESYLTGSQNVSEEVLQSIRSINRELNSEVKKWENRSLNWKLKRFEFSNMFSYGEGNAIDFTQANGIIGIFADNASGKSSILDAISYCLFDRCSRTRKSKKVLNNDSDWFSSKAVLEINGKEYVIERSGEKKGHQGRVPVDVNFYVKEDGGNTTSLNGERRRETNKNIREYIGEYEEFITTALSTQTDGTVFVEKTQAERKDMLSRFIGIDVFDKLHGKAKDRRREATTLLKEYEGDNLSQDISSAEKRHEKALSAYKKLSSKEEALEKKIEVKNEKLVSLNQKLKDVSVEDVDISSLKEKKTRLEDKKESVAEDVEHFHIKKRELQQPLEGYKELLESSFDIEKVKNRYEKWKNKKEKLSGNKTRAKNLKERRRQLKDSIEHIKSHSEFDPDCKYCVQRNEKDAKKLEEYQKDLRSVESEFQNVMSESKTLKEEVEDESPKEDFERVEEIQEKIETIEGKVENFKSKANEKEVKLSEVKSNLSTVRSQIEEYKKKKEDLKHNQEIRAKIEPVKEEISSLEKEKKKVSKEAREKHSDMKVAERDKEEAARKLKKYRKLKKENRAYEYYLEATKRDGVPYELIGRAMPTIESEVNSILSSMVDFTVSMELDGKNVDAFISYNEEDTWPLEIASNFERFISSLAIRIALINVANLPSPNFLAIDEGFSSADRTNLNNMGLLFDYLKTQFQFAVVISHVDMMRDMVDDLMEIRSSGSEKSKVTYI